MNKQVNPSQEAIKGEPRYCIPREISEEEAILSLAEGWSTIEPPTPEMLERSYYAKAFEKIRQGKWTWNWTAAYFEISWLLYKKMGFTALSFLVVQATLGSPMMILLQQELARLLNPKRLEITILLAALFFILLRFCLMGFFGNYLLLNSVKRKEKEGYALWYSERSAKLFKFSMSVFTAIWYAFSTIHFLLSFRLIRRRVFPHDFWSGATTCFTSRVLSNDFLLGAVICFGAVVFILSFGTMLYEKRRSQKAKKEKRSSFFA